MPGLPATIARRLKETPGVIAEGFDAVTLLFPDIVGFTVFAEARPPEEAVAVLNGSFSLSVELADRHGVVTLKPFGAASIVAAAEPAPRPDTHTALQ